MVTVVSVCIGVGCESMATFVSVCIASEVGLWLHLYQYVSRRT